jgi:putative membrane protein
MLNEGPKTPKPQEFAQSAAQSDGYELAAAQTALAQSRNPQVRAFAERMITDHEQTARALRDAAKASGLEPPHPHVGGDQSRFLASLQSLRGEDFDREYGRQQMLAHTSALAMMRSYADKGSDANLRRMAAWSAPIIERHLQAARQLQQLFM